MLRTISWSKTFEVVLVASSAVSLIAIFVIWKLLCQGNPAIIKLLAS